MSDAEPTDDVAPLLATGALADYTPPGSEDADTIPPEAQADADGAGVVRRRVLADVLPVLDTEREPGDAGGVPLPDAWACMRAVFGGAARKDLEHAHAPRVYGGQDLRGNEAEDVLRGAQRIGTHLPPGLHIVTGQTGGGKSALVINLAHAAIGSGHPVLYVSLELDAEELAARLLALETELPWGALALRRAMTDTQRAERTAGIARLTERAGRFVALVPDGAMPQGEIRRQVLALWREHGRPPLVVFDYLQAAAIADPGGSWQLPLRQHIAAVTMELRRLSRKMDDVPEWQGCPVVVLSLTARSNVTGERVVPGLDGMTPDHLRKADLETLKALPKEAGEVEATAVTAWVMALGQDEVNKVRPLTMRLAKSRMGPSGQWIPFAFHAVTGRLHEAPGRYAEAMDADRAAVEERERRDEERAAQRDVRPPTNGNGRRTRIAEGDR